MSGLQKPRDPIRGAVESPRVKGVRPDVVHETELRRLRQTIESNLPSGTSGPHAASHQNGGSDEVSVAGLSGVLADAQEANKIRETSGPTTLTVGAVADGEFLKRSGATVVGDPGGGGGDNITVNGVAVSNADFDDATPAAPAGEINVKWQKDASSPANISASVQAATTAVKGVVELATSGESAANVVVQGNDARLSDSRAPSGSAGGDLGGTYPNPTVTQARGLRESAGPTTLAMGSVSDGQFLKRVGTDIVGAAVGAHEHDAADVISGTFNVARVGTSSGDATTFLNGSGAFSAVTGLPTVKRLNSQHDIASTTGTEVTDLSSTLTAGTYVFTYYLITQTANTTVGLALGINYTGTATALAAHMRYADTGTTATSGVADSATAGTAEEMCGIFATITESTTACNLGPLTNHDAASTNTLIIVEGIIVVSDGGDLELWHNSDAATTTSIMVGSSLILHRTA